MSVKRYEGSHLAEMSVGSVVRYSDYLSLQAALREALTEWEGWQDEARGERDPRIAALRAQFLDDHPSKEPS